MQFFTIVFLLFTGFLFLGCYGIFREVKFIENTDGNEKAKKDINRIKKIIIIWFLFATPFIIYLSLLGVETFQEKLPYTLAMLYMAFTAIVLSEGALLFLIGKNGILIKQPIKPNK